MKLTANITLDELTKSQVAERKGINNNPNPAQIENLKALATNILQPVRSHFDKPLNYIVRIPLCTAVPRDRKFS